MGLRMRILRGMRAVGDCGERLCCCAASQYLRFFLLLYLCIAREKSISRYLILALIGILKA
jgi:hypothetical protein